MKDEFDISSDAILTQNEEYKIWRKNIPYLYDLVLSHSLIWPSLTIEWFPQVTRDENNATSTQKLLISTQTSQSDQEYLQIASVTFPDGTTELDATNSGLNAHDSGFTYGEGNFSIIQRIAVPKEINKARCNTQLSNVIACRTDDKDVLIYDYTKHLTNSNESTPDLVLSGHEEGGYGLAWNKKRNSELISTGTDMKICLWNLNMASKEDKVIKPVHSFHGHTRTINDCSFNNTNENVFVSVSDDRRICIWDTRSKTLVRSIKVQEGSDILTVDFGKYQESFFATGASDGVVKIWDLRYLERPMHLFAGHRKEVVNVAWSPNYNSLLASSSLDGRIIIWDIDKVGFQQTEEEADEGPPELLFIHGGHIDCINDFDWNPLEPMEIASVAADNSLQIWQKCQTVEIDK